PHTGTAVLVCERQPSATATAATGSHTQPRSRVTDKPRAAANAPTANIGASAHHRAALPSLAKGTREGRCPSKPPHSDDEQQEGQPTRVALEHIPTVNDANRHPRPQPDCAGTPDSATPISRGYISLIFAISRIGRLSGRLGRAA